MTGSSFSRLLSLRLDLIQARLESVPRWQTALFAVAFVSTLSSACLLVPVLVRAYWQLDGGLILSTLVFAVALCVIYGVHLLLAASAQDASAARGLDPLDILPVRPEWSFCLNVLEEVCAEPVALLTLLPSLVGVALASPRPLLSVGAALLLAPFLLAAVAGTRLTIGRLAGIYVAPSTKQRILRVIVHASLVVTVVVATCLIYDVSALVRRAGGLEPLDLFSTRLGLPALEFVGAWPRLVRGLPVCWPVLALLGGPGWPLWWGATALATVLSLVAMARLHRLSLCRPCREDPRAQRLSHRAKLAAALHWWMPFSRLELVTMEADAARARGAFSEALVEGTLLVGSLMLVLSLAPSVFGATFVKGVRLVLGLGSILLVTPAVAIAREGAGIGLQRLLPLRAREVLFAKLPVVIYRNILVLMPTALLLPALLPAATLVELVGTALLLGLSAVVGAFAAVGAGMLVNPLAERPAGFGSQVAALGLTLAALTPFMVAAPALELFYAGGAVLGTGLFVAGLWHKSLCRQALLSIPPRQAAPGSLFGDSTLAVLLFLMTAAFLAPSIQRVLPFLHPDIAHAVGLAALHLAVIGGAYLYLRHGDFSLAARPRHILGAIGTGLALGGVVALYGRQLQEFLVPSLEPVSSPIVRLVAGGEGGWATVFLALVVAGVLAPVAEELLFRRLLFQGLYEALGRLLPAVALSALAFSVAHPPAAFPVVCLVGVIGALLLERSGSVVVPIAFHASFNLLQMGLLLARGGP